MSMSNNYRHEKPPFVTLPPPNNSLSFFESIKRESEIYWAETKPSLGISGFQIQQHTIWREGLNEVGLREFERAINMVFPTPLRNFYSVMNGLTKAGINLYGNNGTPFSYRPVFYSYPDDIALINEQIDWIYEATSVNKELLGNSISRIFPIYGHRFMLIDAPGNPILSMYGDDIIYWADNVSKLLANEIFDNINNVSDFESSPERQTEISFWLDLD